LGVGSGPLPPVLGHLDIAPEFSPFIKSGRALSRYAYIYIYLSAYGWMPPTLER